MSERFTISTVDLAPAPASLPGIPPPSPSDPAVNAQAIEALKEAFETIARQRGNIQDSAVFVADLEVVFGQIADLYVAASFGVTNGLNLGGGFQIFSLVVGNAMEFRTLTSNDGSITYIQSADEVDLAVSDIDMGYF